VLGQALLPPELIPMIFQSRERGLQRLMLLLALAMCLLCYLVAFYLRLVLSEGTPLARLWTSQAYAGGLLLSLAGLYLDDLRTRGSALRQIRSRPRWRESVSVSLAQVAMVMFMLALYTLASKDAELSRRFVLLFLGLLLVGLTALHQLGPRGLPGLAFRGRHRCRCLLVATDEQSLQDVHRNLDGMAHLGLVREGEVYLAPGLLAENEGRKAWLAEFAALLRSGHYDAVLLAGCPLEKNFLRRLKSSCDTCGVRLIADLQWPADLASHLLAAPGGVCSSSACTRSPCRIR
jgi:hypothetical protein